MIALLVVWNFLEGRYSDFGEWLLDEIMMIPGIILGLAFHEFGHAFVSSKLGDPTPRRQGRVTLNPLAHIDPVGLLCLLFAGFGWGMPVEIDPRYYKHPRRDEFLVSIAGVVMNLILAVLFTLVLHFIVVSDLGFFYTGRGAAVIQVIQYTIFVNVMLMVFNLLPVPPLDGFGILTQILDLKRYSWYYTVYQNGFFILMLLIIFGGTDFVLTPLIQLVMSLLQHLI